MVIFVSDVEGVLGKDVRAGTEIADTYVKSVDIFLRNDDQLTAFVFVLKSGDLKRVQIGAFRSLFRFGVIAVRLQDFFRPVRHEYPRIGGGPGRFFLGTADKRRAQSGA